MPLLKKEEHGVYQIYILETVMLKFMNGGAIWKKAFSNGSTALRVFNSGDRVSICGSSRSRSEGEIGIVGEGAKLRFAFQRSPQKKNIVD